MAKDRLSIMTANAAVWGIPQTAATDFGGILEAAETALDTAENETTRTPATTARCKAAFDDLTTHMRDTKRRYFLSPPLAEADFVSLGLKPHDPHPAPLGPPTAQATVETFLAGRHELGIKMVYVTGSPDDPANKGFRVWYSVTGQGETPPASPEICLTMGRTGRRGVRGPMVSVLIP
jgi:hypothetical protein